MTTEINRLLESRAAVPRARRPIALALSAAVHCGALALLLLPALGRPAAGQPFSLPSAQVRIVGAGELEGGGARAAAPVPPAQVAPPAPSKPHVVEQIPPAQRRRATEKKTRKQDEPPKRESPVKEERQQPASAPGGLAEPATGSHASTGRGGAVGIGTGPGGAALSGVEGGDFRFAWYLDLVVTKISGIWQEPLIEGRASERLRVTVYFRIHRDGSVSDVRVEGSSGIEMLDLSAVRAVREAAPLPPLPQQYSGGQLGVHFWFDYEVK